MKRQSVFVIAEAGVNHDGDLDKAFKLIDAAADAGADCVKFQTFEASKLATSSLERAPYQKTEALESQQEMLRRLELPQQWHHDLLKRSRDRNIVFLSSPFDTDSLSFLAQDLNLATIKLGSGELTNAPLLYAAGRTEKKMILSTGMSALKDIERALSALACGYLRQEPTAENFSKIYASDAGSRAIKENVTLLHCVTEYPAPYEEVNLKAMDALKEAFSLPVGYSDHAKGIAVAIAAAARGAEVIEKHLTLDSTSVGPDHRSSLEPAEFKTMVDAIRQVELALGDGVKEAQPSEKKNIAVVRKTIVAVCPIATAEIFTPENIAVLRGGNGPSPFDYWKLLGQRASRGYKTGEPIT